MNKITKRLKTIAPMFLGVFVASVIFTAFITQTNTFKKTIGNVNILGAKKSLIEENQSIKSRKVIREGKNYVDGQLIVKFKNDRLNFKKESGKEKSKIDSLSDKKEVELVDILEEENIVVFDIYDSKTVPEKINELKLDPDVEYVQPNYQYYPLSINTNDTSKANMWGLDNTGQTVNTIAGSNDADIDAPEAWALTTGTTEPIVAVIDSGVAHAHPDLEANMWDGTNCVDENGEALGNCIHGYDYEDNDKDPTPDSDSHGTHVAGTIGAVRNNSEGILGVAPKVRIMALKSSLTTTEIVKAISFAEENGARIINASWGGSGVSCEAVYDSALYTAISGYNGLFVAAAGNSTENHDGATYFMEPGDYGTTTSCWAGLSNIIQVAATDSDDALGDFSDYGANFVHIGAPGGTDADERELIYSTVAESSAVNQNFSGVTPPNIPAGWVRSAPNSDIWATYQTASSSWGITLFTDVGGSLTSYSENMNATITSPAYSLSGANGAVLNFWVDCDTEYDADYWTDYLDLEFSSDGVNFSSVLKIDENYIDYLNGDISSEGDAVYAFDGDVELENSYLTSNFKFRFRWVTNASDNAHMGCAVDGIELVRITNGEEGLYDFYNGTSMAAPHVSGLAAYLLSYDNTMTTSQIRSTILTTGDSLDSLSGKTTTGKRINAYTAILSVIDPVLAEVTPVPASTTDTTPDYTFSSTKAGTITYGGSCSSPITSASADNNTITFNTLDIGSHSDCTIRVTDSYSNQSNVLSVSTFQVVDGPVLTEVTSIPDYTNDPTPDYTFNSSHTGDIDYGGSCSSSITTASASDNTITLETLVDGSYSDCTLQVTTSDVPPESSNVLLISSFIVDTSAPSISEITPVSTPTEDNTPEYTFSTTETGTIAYGGSCSSEITSASSGNNTISFEPLENNTYSDCTIVVSDLAGNSSNTLSITEFTVNDTTPPTLTEVTPIGSTEDTTPNYTFNSTEDGTIAYSGSCTSPDTDAEEGDNTITLNALGAGTYSDCSLTVTDIGENESESLSITSFEITEEEEEEEGELEIKITSQKNNKGYYKYGTRIKLAANSDNVDKIFYRWNKNSNWREYHNPIKLKSGKNTLYWKAVDDSGNTLESNSQLWKVRQPDYLDDLKANIEAPGIVKLTWDTEGLPSSKVEKIEIHRSKTNNGSYETNDKTKLGENRDEDTDFTDRNVKENGEYIYKVLALNSDTEVKDKMLVVVNMTGIITTPPAVYTPLNNNVNSSPTTPPTQNNNVLGMSQENSVNEFFGARPEESDASLDNETKSDEFEHQLAAGEKYVTLSYPGSVNASKPKINVFWYVIAPSLGIALLVTSIRYRLEKSEKEKYY